MRCCIRILGSSVCERSHQTVAFCFLSKATYEVGGGPEDLPDEDLRIELWEELVEEVALESVRRVCGLPNDDIVG